jgi:hypothetical protein
MATAMPAPVKDSGAFPLVVPIAAREFCASSRDFRAVASALELWPRQLNAAA